MKLNSAAAAIAGAALVLGGCERSPDAAETTASSPSLSASLPKIPEAAAGAMPSSSPNGSDRAKIAPLECDTPYDAVRREYLEQRFQERLAERLPLPARELDPVSERVNTKHALVNCFNFSMQSRYGEVFVSSEAGQELVKSYEGCVSDSDVEKFISARRSETDARERQVILDAVHSIMQGIEARGLKDLFLKQAVGTTNNQD